MIKTYAVKLKLIEGISIGGGYLFLSSIVHFFEGTLLVPEFSLGGVSAVFIFKSVEAMHIASREN